MDGEVWKLVAVDPGDGSMWSYVGFSPYNLQYREDQITKPFFGKLFAFKTARAARAVGHKYFGSSAQLWKAWGTEVEEAPMLVPSRSLDYKEFWKTGKIGVAKMQPPQGTILCDSIKLLERTA